MFGGLVLSPRTWNAGMVEYWNVDIKEKPITIYIN